jgi:3-hydroxyisobutyrate dehydrogenase
MKIGFIGLGRMGAPMALNIAKAGAELIIWDENQDAVRSFGAASVVAKSAADLAANSDIVFTSLPGPPQVESVVFGPAGLIEGVKRGQAYFDLSTNSLQVVRKVHQAYADRGATMFDAPVSGGPAGAASGQLAIWIGGDLDVFERSLPILCTFSDSPRRIGDVGAGTIAKLVHNLSCYIMLDALAETFSLGAKAGVEPLALWEALYSGMMGRGSMLDMVAQKFLSGDYQKASFALKLGYKDVALAVDLGKQVGVPMRLAAQTLEDMTEAMAKGMGDLDSHSYMDLQLQRAGVTIAVPPERVAEAKRKIAGDIAKKYASLKN